MAGWQAKESRSIDAYILRSSRDSCRELGMDTLRLALRHKRRVRVFSLCELPLISWGEKLPPWPLCQMISTAKLMEHTVAPLLKLGIMTNGSKLMWLEGFSSNNCLEYFKTCYKPCLGHRGLDSRLRNNVMFQSLVAVILRKMKRLLFLSTFILFFLMRLFSPKTVLVFALDFYFFIFSDRFGERMQSGLGLNCWSSFVNISNAERTSSFHRGPRLSGIWSLESWEVFLDA